MAEGSALPKRLSTFLIAEYSLPLNLIEKIQTELIRLGLLDPPVDGVWGQQSKTSMRQFLHLAGKGPSDQASEENYDSLIQYLDPGLVLQDDAASKIIKYMNDHNMFISREEDRYNIVYLEGVNPDFGINDDRPDYWNDLRLVVSVVGGKPKIEGKWTATTEPGYYYTVKKLLDPQGAFRIAFGQYRAWRVGVHRKDHEGLIQRAPIKGHRDIDKNFKRVGDPVVFGEYGINQHWGYDQEKIGKASAGCLVGQFKTGHKEFMSIVKSDIRFKANAKVLFNTAVLDGRKLFL